MRQLIAALQGFVLIASTSHAGTLLFLNSEPGDYVGAGLQQIFTPSDGTFTATGSVGSAVIISFDGGPSGHFWYVELAAPMQATLTPGTYENATRYPFQAPTEPGLSVFGDGRGCNTLTGRFVVLEATYGGGDLLSLAADFEQHCEGSAPALLGSVRFHAGDPDCAVAGEGAPCDDRDACTGGDVCHAGVCAGSPLAPCTPPDSCHTAACDPATGTCDRSALPDYATCDDGDACTLSDTCQGGVCTPGYPMPCPSGTPCLGACRDGACDYTVPTVCADDGDPCTQEYCDPALSGCTSRAVAGCCHVDADCNDNNPCTADSCGPGNRCLNEPLPCWSIQGKATAVASAQGRTARQMRRFVGVLILDVGTYRIPSGPCPSTGAPLPDEVGTTRPGRRGRVVLEATNLADLYAALNACFGTRVVVTRYRAWVKILPDLQHLRGQTTLRAHTRVQGVVVQILVVDRFRGEKVSGGPTALAPDTRAVAVGALIRDAD